MKHSFLAAYIMSFSSVHRGGAARNLSVELRGLLLGSCGGGYLGWYPRRPVLTPPQISIQPRGVYVVLRAASVYPAQLPPMELSPLWASGFHCQTPARS
eukprot:3809108-Pleurochrysis_carterae.AAC.1